MSQNPLADVGAQSPKTTGLKPPLAAALASLEVQLDQELARYRRTRIKSRTPNQPQTGSSAIGKQQLTATSTTGGSTQLPIEDTLVSNPQQVAITTEPTSNVLPAQQEQPNTEVKSQTSPLVSEAPHQQVRKDSVTQNTAASQESRLPEQEDNSQVPTLTDSEPTHSAGLVPTALQPPKHSNQPQPDPTSADPDDYLESSEALLRSLTGEQTKTQKRSHTSDHLLSPLGIGSMLLLVMASLTLGYVLFNPKNLPQFNIESLLKRTQQPKAGDSQQAENINTSGEAQPQTTPIPKFPNLVASDEFPEVKEPNDVVGLKPKPKPFIATSPPATTTQNPTPPLPALPQAVQPVNPPNVLSTPETTPSEPPTNVQIQPSADGFYHVVTDNQDSNSLAAARQIVPDAYLSIHGKLIYLGAVKSKEQAQQLIQELQARGIKARIQQNSTEQ